MPPHTSTSPHFHSRFGKAALYYISDLAYDALCQQAKDYGYSTISSRGLRDYIFELSRIRLADNRPSYLISDSYRLLKQGKWPVWHMNDAAKPRRISLRDSAIQNLNTLAVEFGIHERQHDGPNPIAAAVLEAIGLGFLKPIGPVPTGKWYSKVPRLAPKYIILDTPSVVSPDYNKDT